MNFVVSVTSLSGFYVIVAGLERVPGLRFRAVPRPRPYLSADVAWYVGAVVASAISVFVLRPQLARLAIAPVAGHVRSLPAVGQLLLALVVFDFASFVLHVGLHRSNPLWSVHKVHHSTLQLDGFATTRAHMFENFVRFVPAQAVLFVVGVPAGLVTPTVAIAAAYGISNHSNLRTDLRWAEAVLVTPRLHRRHHIPATTQHNFGTVFTIWDRMFGTLLRHDAAPNERFGVPGEIDTYPQHFSSAVRQPLVDTRRQHGHRRRTQDGVEAVNP
jgi:sterol desaturase/sphingolipid hydroxylase (fatty acid hydroxylase superfamily)